MRVLITGGAGFVGSHLSEALLERGDDVFVLDSLDKSAPGGHLRDVITDFRHSHDRIELLTIDADSGRGRNQAFSWHGASDFIEGRAGLLIEQTFNRPGSDHDETVISGDVDGDARADFQIELSGLKSLSQGDFLL